ncbi:unannotated protein [freshwater metagenome]|uniref:Unannotated protein n=1 Tax=freshwater metagenome TaxID=449393 RepID=A0A6J6XW68_9ZZZZ
MIVGALGTVIIRGDSGVTAFDAAEGAPVPTAFVAVTVNEYATPLVRPVTRHDDEAEVQPFPAPSLTV